MLGPRVIAVALLLLTAVTAIDVADSKKGVEVPVAPAFQSSAGDSLSTTLSTPTTASPVDITSLLASLSSAQSASNGNVDTSSILAALSSQLAASLTQSNSKSTPTSSSRSTKAVSSKATTTSSATSTPSSSTVANSNSPSNGNTGSNNDNKRLTIILAAVLSILFLFLATIAVVLVLRYRRGRSPFSSLAKRGATPIDDDEIATWRTNSQAMAQTSPGSSNGHNHNRTASSIIFTPSPGHSWNVQSVPNTPSPVPTPYGNSPTRSKSRPSSNNNAMPEPPALVARAPNSRSGLTDEAIPGADPFLPPLKRQSTRLSKNPNGGHARTKSRRSSRGSVASNMTGGANHHTSGSNSNANAFGLGRFSFDRVAPENHATLTGDRTRSLSERNQGGLGSNPFGGPIGVAKTNGSGYSNTQPFSFGLEDGPGGLWPPPPRKMSFPEGMVGVAS